MCAKIQHEGVGESVDDPHPPVPAPMETIPEQISAALSQGSSIPNAECQQRAILNLIKVSGLEEELKRFFLETPEPESLEDFVRQFLSHFS